MILVKIMGGFASQLNKFIFGYSLADFCHTEFAIDLSDYTEGYFRNYCLHYLNIPKAKIYYTQKEILKIKNRIIVKNNDQLEYVLDNPQKNHHIICEEKDCSEFLNKYSFFKVTGNNIIIKNLKLVEESEFLKKFKEQIKGKYSVAIHIRRGDFTTLGWADDTRFFKGIISKIFFSNNNSEFYFFSNDLAWCIKEFGKNERFHFVSSLKGSRGDIEEVFCMSLCNMRVLSKFSNFGILANVLAVHNCPKGFAVVDGSGMLEREVELKNDDSLIQHYRETVVRARDSVVGEKDRSQIFYCNKEQYDAWEIKYKNIVNENTKIERLDKKSALEEVGIDISKANDSKCFFKMKQNFDIAKKESRNEAEEILVKLQMSQYCNMNFEKEWEEFYGLKKCNDNVFILFSYIAKDRWKLNGLYKVGMILSRIGYRVYFVEMALISTKKLKQKKVITWEYAKNMDGNKSKMLKLSENLTVSVDDIIHHFSCNDMPFCLVTDWNFPNKIKALHMIKICGLMTYKDYLKYFYKKMKCGNANLIREETFARKYGRKVKKIYFKEPSKSNYKNNLLEDVEKEYLKIVKKILE